MYCILFTLFISYKTLRINVESHFYATPQDVYVKQSETY